MIVAINRTTGTGMKLNANGRRNSAAKGSVSMTNASVRKMSAMKEK